MYYDDNIQYINKVQIDDEYYTISNLTDGTHTVHLPELGDDDEFVLRGSCDADLAKLEQGKADKKSPSAANNVALLDSGGNLADSGKQFSPAGIGALASNGKAVDAAKADGVTAYNDSSKVIKIGYAPRQLISTASYVAGYDNSGNIATMSWGAAAGAESSAALVLSDSVLNRVCSGSSIGFGEWTPTIADATVSSYSQQQGWYLKIGNVVIVGWYLYVKFATGQTANKYKITGLPYTPSAAGSGGGVCSGYYASDQVNFSGWYAGRNGNIYAYGVTNGAAGNKWAEEKIFCGTGDSYSTGTIIYRTSLE